MSDDVDEWAHELRCELDKATAAGLATVTITAPVTALLMIVDTMHSYFRDERPRCFMCDVRLDQQNTLKGLPLVVTVKGKPWRPNR